MGRSVIVRVDKEFSEYVKNNSRRYNLPTTRYTYLLYEALSRANPNIKFQPGVVRKRQRSALPNKGAMMEFEFGL